MPYITAGQLMARSFTATWAAGPIQPLPELTDAEADALYAPRTRAEAERRRKEHELHAAARREPQSEDELEQLLRATVFNYPDAPGEA